MACIQDDKNICIHEILIWGHKMDPIPHPSRIIFLIFITQHFRGLQNIFHINLLAIIVISLLLLNTDSAFQITKFMGPTWGPPGSCRPQMGPMLAQWTLLSGLFMSMVFYQCSMAQVAIQYHYMFDVVWRVSALVGHLGLSPDLQSP